MVSDSRPGAVTETSATSVRTPLGNDTPDSAPPTVRDVSVLRIRPMSWSGVIAGCIAALGLQLILTMLGLGLGALAVDPMTEAEPGRGLGIGVIVWGILSGIISFGLGGFIASRTATSVNSMSGVLQGGLAWALAAVLGVALTAMSTSAVAGGGLAGIGQGLGAMGSRLDRSVWPEGWSAYGRDQAPGRDAYGVLDRTRTGNRPADAEGTLGGDAARADTAGAYPRTEEDARAAAEAAADALGRSALWTCVALLFGAGAACAGGAIGGGHDKRARAAMA